MSSLEALQKARDKSLDLIEVAPNSSPPTCKIMDYGKWKYEQKKKESQARKKQVIVQVKEIKLRPRTETHDLNTKLNKAQGFLEKGDKVKITLRFSGRELAHKDQGFKILESISERLSEHSFVVSPIKMEGRQMFMILAPGSAPSNTKTPKKKVDKKKTVVSGSTAKPSLNKASS